MKDTIEAPHKRPEQAPYEGKSELKPPSTRMILRGDLDRVTKVLRSRPADI